MADVSALAGRIDAVRARIAAAERSSGRAPGSVTLLAVGKTFGPEALARAAECGISDFGENYLQEALPKIAALASRPAVPGNPGPLRWHFIGPIQSNKTRQIAAQFDWVHTIDRARAAARLSEQRPPGMAPLQVLIEVNLDGEAGKGGIAPDQAHALALEVARLPRLALRGLMAIPRPETDPARQGAVFARLARLLGELRGSVGAGFDTLSMGMSGDFEAAIGEGATIVRIGSAIFGERK
jgi:PLP dependent protein